MLRPAPGPTWIAHADPRATQLLVSLWFVATSDRAGRAAARAIAEEILAQRLKYVRSDLSASYGVSARYRTSRFGDAIRIEGNCDAARAGAAVRWILDALERLRLGDGELAADFVRARRKLLAAALADAADVGAMADRLEDAVVDGLPVDGGAWEMKAVAATTVADVQAVLAADLQPARMVGLLSGAKQVVDATLAAAGITGAVQVAEPN